MTLPLVPAVTLVPDRVTLAVGDSGRLFATVEGRPCDCIWTTNEPTRAAVDASGMVRAVAAGHVTITASYRREMNAKASSLIEVIEP